MRRFLASLLAGVLVASAAHAAELSVRLVAREIARKRVHTRLGLDVHQGPLTLAFPKENLLRSNNSATGRARGRWDGG